MIVTMIGVSCSPFLREFCGIPRFENPVHATNLPKRISATQRRPECGSYLDQRLSGQTTIEYIGTRP